MATLVNILGDNYNWIDMMLGPEPPSAAAARRRLGEKMLPCSAAKGALPSVRGAADALEQAASSCTFEWSLSAPKFLNVTEDGEMSPPFWAAGGEWRLILSSSEISEDMFGVFLCFFF
jgi:hypothetical protein